ncbi:MAG: disulfide bond formation protein B [Caldibacillus debilis]|jgi:disulfide bond formation protein DsbB|uniref:Probable disulfide formation protein n=2 Tax=Caldibacillus debilis TaxID=301148 RepID=A0A420VB17_9BACI|nr:disulfide oxidoreductase [Caldibacillus debilis]MBO2482361.1 disulfide bond formation protein B [Bacillaceae bacterium]MBY6270778.1 disulfide bond formation protein B [Bacillaceae bacterium]OUM89602.1 MAG: disulfide bond formation protein DsbB [Caldibacillus debilis]REJ14509.1 MAG: disulfide bond formation protein B [Caldibacillus debilis]REJ22592.1 MAG: disulfide bond formation protein B [Caldibacillus debilis]
MFYDQKKMESYLFFSWCVSIVATFGSLYFSEIRQFEPCELCWYQRILMYPLTVLLGMAVVRKDFRISLYALVLSVIGGSISLYHYLIQKVPFFTENAISCGRIPCTAQYINWFGFITIPFLALTAFILIAGANYIVWKKWKEANW